MRHPNPLIRYVSQLSGRGWSCTWATRRVRDAGRPRQPGVAAAVPLPSSLRVRPGPPSHGVVAPAPQAAFHVFGMELLTRLDLASTNQFFSTFFRLPDTYWRGFLASRLSSMQVGRRPPRP